MKVFAEKIGTSIIQFFHNLGESIILMGKVLSSIFRKGFPVSETVKQIAKIGYESLPVILVTSFFTGMVLAFQTGTYMEQKIKGVARFMGGGIALSMVRELGPVLTALLVAGRSGSAIAAEIGTMRVTEQIDALTSLATNPVQYLLLPRVIAGLVAMPLLVIFADIMGILGGGIIANLVINQPWAIYMDAVSKFINANQVFHGLVKSIIFGYLVAFLSCAKGFGVRGGSEEVGKATTKAVVSSSLAIFFADYVFTAITSL